MTSYNPLSLDELSSAIQSQLILSSPPSKEKKAASKSSKPSKPKQEKTTPSSQPAKASTSYDRWSLLPESRIDYGHFSSNPHPESLSGFYITTAINYTNGPAHMGHAYEAVTSDCIARYRRLITRPGEGCWFVTGSDEHGQKIKTTAEGEGKTPIDICDKYVTGFRCLNQRLLVSNDDYVRTTSSRHKSVAQKLWSLVKDDIYLSKYTGWYNVREETFVTDSDAQLWEYKDPTSGKPLKKVSEESYFFKMSQYHNWLVSYIEENEGFIRPAFQRNAILARLKADELRDLSISRTTFDWGVTVPGDDKHVMYVWIDALSNYLTGVDALATAAGGDGGGGGGDLKGYWPANVHVIGKDILWFHTVIWPTLLKAAGLPIPECVFAHGFVNDKFGKKMSKSVGNVVDPHDMLDKYTVDTFRWYTCKEAPYGGELSFSEDSLRDMHNADLADTLGNLIHRATNLCGKYCAGEVVSVDRPSELPVDFGKVRNMFVEHMNKYELNEGANVAMQAFRDVNGYLTEKEPWKMKGEGVEERRKIVVILTLEAVYALAHLLTPFLPDGAKTIFQKLATKPKHLWQLKDNLTNLDLGTKIQVGDILYAKIQSEEELKNAAEAAKKKQESYAAAQQRKKAAKAKQAAASQSGQKNKSPANNTNQPAFTKLDVRVGQIKKVWHHPDADKLFCEEIDVGEDAPRQIASGLRQHYQLSEMQDARVLVVCNLKPAKIVGFTSNGMVLAAKGDDKVELVTPPEDCQVGERVMVEGVKDGEFEPLSAAQIKKKKVFEEVAKGLKTGEAGVAMWEGKKLLVGDKGACKANTLVGAPIS